MTTNLHAASDNATNAPKNAPCWDEPIPFDSTRSLPAFPTSALPSWLAEMVSALAESTQTPEDLAGCMALSATSTAIGGRTSIQVRPDCTEPSNLFVISALPPGTRKSEVFRVMTSPVLAVERELAEAAEPKITAAQMAKSVAESEASKAEKKASSDNQDSVDDASEAAMHFKRIDVPAKPKLVVKDITVEKITDRLIEQGGRLAVLEPEGGIVSIIGGRYSGGPNFDVFLAGHAGEPLDCERKGGEELRVDAAHLTVGLVVQPVVLKNLAAIRAARDKGLLGRFLYSLPTSTLGFRNIRAAPIPPETATAYDTRMRTLVHHYAGLSDPAPLRFSRRRPPQASAHAGPTARDRGDEPGHRVCDTCRRDVGYRIPENPTDPEQTSRPVDERAGVAGIGPQVPHARAQVLQPGHEVAGGGAILDVGAGDQHADRQTAGVHGDMAFAAVDLLGRVEAAAAGSDGLGGFEEKPNRSSRHWARPGGLHPAGPGPVTRRGGVGSHRAVPTPRNGCTQWARVGSILAGHAT